MQLILRRWRAAHSLKQWPPRAVIYNLTVVVFDAQIHLIVASLSSFNCGVASQVRELTEKKHLATRPQVWTQKFNLT